MKAFLFSLLLIATSCTSDRNKFIGEWSMDSSSDKAAFLIIKDNDRNFIVKVANSKIIAPAFYDDKKNKLVIQFPNDNTDCIYMEDEDKLLLPGGTLSRIK